MKALKTVRYFSGLLALMLILNTTPAVAQTDPILVADNPPLTQGMVGEVYIFCIWLTGRESAATYKWVEAYLRGNWAYDEETIEATEAIVEVGYLLRQLSDRELQLVRNNVLASLPNEDAGYLFDGLCSPTPRAGQDGYAHAALEAANKTWFDASQQLAGNIR